MNRKITLSRFLDQMSADPVPISEADVSSSTAFESQVGPSIRALVQKFLRTNKNNHARHSLIVSVAVMATEPKEHVIGLVESINQGTRM